MKLPDHQKQTEKILPGILHAVPDDMQKTLGARADILTQWNSLTPIQRNEWICWVTLVKQQKTRDEHMRKMIEKLQAGDRQPCCWPGCSHRRPSAQKWFH